MVLTLMFALLTVALATLAVVAASAGAVEREYRASQALALAEGGLALARIDAQATRESRAGSGSRRFEEGEMRWQRTPCSGGWELRGSGRVRLPSGAVITREVKAQLRRQGGRSILSDWHEEAAR
jgi:hypothetical protein